jgi:uncharacterized protein (DUF58 family)
VSAALPSLLDPAFTRELAALSRLFDVRARSGAPGAGTTSRRGAAPEFEEHRAYAPGDDATKLDFLAFARTGVPVSKVYRADEDALVRLVVDASLSLDFGTPRKLDVATRMAAAVAHLALTASERAQVIVATGDSGQTSLRTRAARRGRGAIGAILRELSAVEPRGGIALAEAVRRALALPGRPGLLVVISDFLDAEPVVPALSRARHAGHDVVLVQVLAPEELSPELEGDVLLVDAETGAELELTLDAETLGAYLAGLRSLFDALAAFARREGATYVRVRTDEPLPSAVRRLVARKVD